MRRTYLDAGPIAQLPRGGSWNNHPRNCRSAYRNHNQPDNANNNVGLRVEVSGSAIDAGPAPFFSPRP